MRLNRLTILFFILAAACSPVNEEKKSNDSIYNNWENLIDISLSKWDTYLSFQHMPDYDGTPPENERGELITPIGLNNDAYKVFTTIQEGEHIVIRNSGEYYGCLITREEYKNYHFQLKYKWGEKKWIPRIDKFRDSGILYHSIGPPGVEFWRSWMLSQEFQIMEGHTGDYWCQANSAIDIRAYKAESSMSPMADESQEYLPFSMYGPNKNYCLRSKNNENSINEWNTLDLYCFEGKSLHVVNGEVVMILKNSRYLDENGKSYPLIEGKIQLQSEAAEVIFKDIRIREIEALSPEQTALF